MKSILKLIYIFLFILLLPRVVFCIEIIKNSSTGGSSFNGGTITSNLQVVGSITANAILVPPSVTPVIYVNGTTTVTWANVNTPQVASLTLAGATTTVNMTGAGTGSVLYLFVKQDGTGTRTAVVATATCYLPGGVNPVWSASPNAVDITVWIFDGNYRLLSFIPDSKSK